jgi:hypothetical protein
MVSQIVAVVYSYTFLELAFDVLAVIYAYRLTKLTGAFRGWVLMILAVVLITVQGTSSVLSLLIFFPEAELEALIASIGTGVLVEGAVVGVGVPCVYSEQCSSSTGHSNESRQNNRIQFDDGFGPSMVIAHECLSNKGIARRVGHETQSGELAGRTTLELKGGEVTSRLMPWPESGHPCGCPFRDRFTKPYCVEA